MDVPDRCKRSQVLAAEVIEDKAIEYAQAALDRARDPTPSPAPRRKRRARPVFRWHGFRATTPTPDAVEEYRNRPDFETVVEIRPRPVPPNPRLDRRADQESPMANATAPRSYPFNRLPASDELATLQSELATIIQSGETAKRLVCNVIALQSERLGCNGSWNDVLEAMKNEDGSPAWGRRLGFARRLLQVVPETLRRLEDQRLTAFGLVLVTWQATVGVVFFWEEGADEVFSREDYRIAGALKKTPEAKAAFEKACRQTRPAPAPKPAPRPAAPDLDALLQSGGGKAEVSRQQPPRGERGGNRGHGQGSKPAAPAPRSETDEDDERQPPAGAHEATSLVDIVQAEAQALASGDRRRR